MSNKSEMIERQLKNRGITDKAVIRAMEKVDRKLFIPEELQDKAYEDGPLPIGKGQTISQPYIVAYMAQKLGLNKDSKVLEIGTGCGYNAAVMAQIADHVYSLEIVEWLADLADKNLQKAGIHHVSAKHGDGFEGWPTQAPFDAITLTAAPPKIPEALKLQLKIGGKLIAPIGTTSQKLILLTRKAKDIFEEKTILMVSFVPMTGAAQA